MKIVCNKYEFARLVRGCTEIKNRDDCSGCVFAPLCTQGGDAMYDEIMVHIEDICELEAGG